MDYTSDSDISDGTRDLVQRGLASVKRRRTTNRSQRERPRERTSVTDMDPSQIRHPLREERVIGASSTHGLNLIEVEIVQAQNHNIVMPQPSFSTKIIVSLETTNGQCFT